MKRYLQCAKQHKSSSNVTKCCACHEKIPLMINPLEAWNAIYNARGSTRHPPTSPNAAPATKNASHDQSSWSMKCHQQCAKQHKASSNVTKCCACHEKYLSMINPLEAWNATNNARSSTRHPPTSRNAVPATKNTSHDQSSWSMKRYLQCAKQHKASSNVTKCCACHEKYLSWSILLKHEKRYLECAKQHKASSNVTKCCACQVKWACKLGDNLGENWLYFHCATDASMIRDRSDHKNASRKPASQPRVLFALARSRFYWRIKPFLFRLSRQISPNAAPARKSDTWTWPNTVPAAKTDSWTSPKAALTKSDTWTSPNAAPARKSDRNDYPKWLSQ